MDLIGDSIGRRTIYGDLVTGRQKLHRGVDPIARAHFRMMVIAAIESIAAKHPILRLSSNVEALIRSKCA